jgi:regulator of cell morphogenesis and NO signaling
MDAVARSIPRPDTSPCTCSSRPSPGPSATLLPLDPAAAVGPATTADLWLRLEPSALCDRIEAHFHAPLRRQLDDVVAVSTRVDAAHADHAARAADLTTTLVGLRDELLPHLAKEEQVLFPMIRAGALPHLAMPVAVMRGEHDATLEVLASLRRRTDAYRPPPDACPTWHELYRQLATLDRDLLLHIGVENELLFPRVLRAARAGRS